MAISGQKLVRGFTLIELLVSLAIFAVVAVTVYTRSGETLVQLRVLEQRTFAHWIAENEMALTRMARHTNSDAMSLGTDHRDVMMGNREWRVTTTLNNTSHPLLRRVDIVVQPVEASGTLGREEHLVGFVGRY